MFTPCPAGRSTITFLTLHRRDGAGFRRETLSGPDAILDLPEAGVSFSLAELYRDVT